MGGPASSSMHIAQQMKEIFPPEGLRLKGRLITHCSIALALEFQIYLYYICIIKHTVVHYIVLYYNTAQHNIV